MTRSPGFTLVTAEPDRLDDARALVAEHDRMRHRIDLVVAHRNVGVADPGGDQPHAHFVWTRLLEIDGLDRERRPDSPRHGRPDLHDFRSARACANCADFMLWLRLYDATALPIQIRPPDPIRRTHDAPLDSPLCDRTRRTRPLGRLWTPETSPRVAAPAISISG